jgi:phosphatidylinositol alpha-1,6-mannosyltransferase
MPPRLACPYAVFLHGIEAWRPLSPGERRVLDRAAALITNSSHTAKRAAAENPGLPPVVVCPLGLSDPARKPERLAGPAGPTILTVARMASTERYKGHDQLLDALPAVRRQIPEAKLVFVGTGDDVARLRVKARALGVSPYVEFRGFLSDDAVTAAYREASLFAMPSRGEGFGLVYLEAMAEGLPCVGSIHDAAVEVIEDGVTGYLIDQQDGGALVDRLVRLLADPARSRDMGQRGRRRWEEHFTYPHFRRRLVAALRATFPVERAVEHEASPIVR